MTLDSEDKVENRGHKSVHYFVSKIDMDQETICKLIKQDSASSLALVRNMKMNNLAIYQTAKQNHKTPKGCKTITN